MDKICGRIRDIDLENRVFEILKRNRILYFYLTRSQIKKFKAYLQPGLFVELEYTKEPKVRGHVKAYDVIGFTKLIGIEKMKRTIYFDMDTIKRGVVKVLNRSGNKMFIDLEFTMPPYEYHGGTYPSEIVQFGFTIENDFGEIILEESQLVKISHPDGLSDRTKDFLKIDDSDLKNAVQPIEFYNILKDVLEKYNPIIMVWGKNDICMLDKFYEQNNFLPLTKRASFINLMQLVKNYFGLKSDVGLFNAVSYFNEQFEMEQVHDALDDALVTSMVYHQFKAYSQKK